jgi:hypothetical protein
MSAAAAAFIAHAMFWGLLAYGWVLGELRTAAAVFLAVWLAGLFGLPYLRYGAATFSSFVAVLDVALVLLIFKGDVRLP